MTKRILINFQASQFSMLPCTRAERAKGIYFSHFFLSKQLRKDERVFCLVCDF